MFNKKDLINFEYCPVLYHQELEKEKESKIVYDLLTKNGAIIEDMFKDAYLKGRNALLIDLNYNPTIMIQKTLNALYDPQIEVIYEATFAFNGIIARIDIFEKNKDGGFTAIEIKSSTNISEDQLKEIDVQNYVLSGLGYNCSYFIGLVDRNTETGFSLNRIDPKNIGDLIQKLKVGSLSKPSPSLEFKCKGCDHFNKCFPEYNNQSTIFNIPRVTEKSFKESIANKSFLLDEDNSYVFLSPLQLSILNKHFTESFINTEYLKTKLEKDVVGFLDFETIYLPFRFGAFKPYEKIPIQFSYIDMFDTKTDYIDNGSLEVINFVELLIKTIPSEGKIGVYNIAFERGVLDYMCLHFPQYEKELKRIMGQLYDIYPIIQKAVYRKEMKFKFDLKSVSKAILGKDYYTGAIKKGDEAMAYFVLSEIYKTHSPDFDVRKELITYCGADTKCLKDLYVHLLHKTIDL